MILPTFKRVLVLAAHPDDEVIGCGGTIARLTNAGAEVFITIVANGITSRKNIPGDAMPGLLQVHHERARQAGAFLGAKEVRVLGFQDQKLDTIPLLDLTQAIEEEISRLQPDAVFTQHGGDLNLDHSLTFRATLTATRPMAGQGLKAVYGYPVPSSTEWAFAQFSPRFTPNTFVDISSTLDRKISAMEIYKSELRDFPHPRSLSALRAAAAHWGSNAGMTAAEPFQLIWTTV